MAIETLDDIVEELADKMGIFGSHDRECCEEDDPCRSHFVSDLKRRIREAVSVEEKLAR